MFGRTPTTPVVIVGCKIPHDKLYNDRNKEKLCCKPKSFIVASKSHLDKIGGLEIVGEFCWRSEEQRCYYVGVVFRKHTVFSTALLESTMNEVRAVLEPLDLWDITTFGITPSEEEVDL